MLGKAFREFRGFKACGLQGKLRCLAGSWISARLQGSAQDVIKECRVHVKVKVLRLSGFVACSNSAIKLMVNVSNWHVSV